MRTRSGSVITVTAALSIAMSSQCIAMDFSRSGFDIYASGPINSGDSERLLEVLGYDDGMSQFYIHMDSNGGDLFEGIKLGRLINQNELETIVDANGSCFSACAIAFLGGVRRYTTGTEPGRIIVWGAHLGFHGFYSKDETIDFENSILEKSRLINGLILDYAREMGGVDLGWLAAALTFPPDQVKLANSPRDIASISAILQGGPTSFPENWDAPICLALINKLGAPSPDDRLYDQYTVLPTIRAIRALTANEVFTKEPYLSFTSELSDDQAISLALGRGFDLTYYKPIIEARVRPIERGYGFYFDNCVTIRTKTAGIAVLVDGLGSRTEWHYFGGDRTGGDETNPLLEFYENDVSLWL